MLIIRASTQYTVLIDGDTVEVYQAEGLVTRETVTGLDRFVRRAKRLTLGWGQFEDFEVIYLYDKGDDNFGYAVNLQDAWLSEWGYAPFT